MTATDELRRLLDERGVEWGDSSDENVLHTTWNGMNCWFNEFSDGWTAWGMAMGGTPEQAVEATMGRGTCRMETEESCQNWMSCSECHADYYNDQPINYCPNCGRRVVS